jgi:hypothetical protein
MTISPLPGTIQRGNVMREAEFYVAAKPDRVGGSILIFFGAVLFLASVGLLVFGL